MGGVDGRQVYESVCAACHQPDGNGLPVPSRRCATLTTCRRTFGAPHGLSWKVCPARSRLMARNTMPSCRR
ncbi:MAG: c-type cytochrome [Pseudomonadota bacterium]